MIRRNLQPPRSGLASDFWRAVVSSAFWNTKEVPRQLCEEARRRIEAKQPPLTLDECASIASDVLQQPLQVVRTNILQFVAEYVRWSFGDARGALRWLTLRDTRLGAWCAAQVARWALAQVPPQRDGSPGSESVVAAREAITETEGWVRGAVRLRATLSAASSAFRVSANAYSGRYISSAGYAASSAGHAAAIPDAAESAGINVAQNTAAQAVEYAAHAFGNTIEALFPLVDVVTDAILGFSTSERSSEKEDTEKEDTLMRPRRNPLPSDPSLLINGRPVGNLVSIVYDSTTLTKRGVPIALGAIRDDLFRVRRYTTLTPNGETDDWFVRSLEYTPWDLVVYSPSRTTSWMFIRDEQLRYGATIIGFLKVGQNLTPSNLPKYQFLLYRRRADSDKERVEIYRIGG